MERRLAAILVADVVGYSRLMGEDEAGTLARLQALRREAIDPLIAECHGRIVKLMGDGLLAEFGSVVDAVGCAAAIQRAMRDHEADIAEARRIRLRIGINLGDVIVEGGDLYGDGVNIAARLQALAEPGGICISGTAYDHARHKVEAGFADLGEKRLKNIADPVRVYQVLVDAPAAPAVVAAPRRLHMRWLLAAAAFLLALGLAGFSWWLAERPPVRPAIAVLPFANLSGDPSQDYFADGITEDLITDLAKLSGIDVIARNSVFALKGQTEALDKIARDLGVRFIVNGSARRTGDQIRVNADLVDARTGDHLWADRFDRKAADVFAIEDQMSAKIIEALGLKPTVAESERLSRPPTANLEAYDNYLRAEQAARTGSRSGLSEALRLFGKAVALDPIFAIAFAADARTTVYVWRNTFDDVLQSAPARKRAYESAGRALALNPDLPLPYAMLAIMQVVDRRYEEAIASARRAKTMGAGDAETQAALGYVYLFAGNHAEAVAAMETALRLDPNLSAVDRQIAGLVFLLDGDDARAIEALERSRKDAPEIGDTSLLLAAAYAHAGRLVDAHALVAARPRNTPKLNSIAAFRLTFAHFRNAKDLDFLIDLLRKAGLPDWPFGFEANERDRLQGDAIAALVLGHTLRGQIEPGQPAIMQIGKDGEAAFRSSAQFITETVLVERDLLCELSENMFGRPDCGPVFRRQGEPNYTYANSSKIFYFSPVD